MTWQNFYEHELVPLVPQFEQERQSQLSKKGRSVGWLVGINLIILVLLLTLVDPEYVGIVFVIEVIFVGLTLVFYFSGTAVNIEKWGQQWQGKIIPALVKQASNDAASFISDGGHTAEDLNKTCFFTEKIKVCRSKNLIKGEVNQQPFAFSQIVVAYDQYDGEQDATSTFIGFLLDTTLPKDTGNQILILPKRQQPVLPLQEVTVDNQNITGQLRVYAKHPEQCRKLFSPAFCDRLIKTNRMFNTPLRMAVLQDKIYLALPTDLNIFNIRPDKPLADTGLDYDYWLTGEIIAIVKAWQYDFTTT